MEVEQVGSDMICFTCMITILVMYHVMCYAPAGILGGQNQRVVWGLVIGQIRDATRNSKRLCNLHVSILGCERWELRKSLKLVAG